MWEVTILMIVAATLILISAAFLTRLHLRTVQRDPASIAGYGQAMDQIDEFMGHVIRAFELMALVVLFDAAAMVTRSADIIVIAVVVNVVVIFYWFFKIARLQLLHQYQGPRKVFLVNVGACAFLFALFFMMKATLSISSSGMAS
jgi:hypothetical protein